MTPNNLHGHTKNIKWGEIYKEKLDENWFLVVTLSKEFSDEYYPHICIKCCVTNGKTHTWTNGVISYKEHIENFWYQKDIAPKALKLTTKDGFICEQFIGQEINGEVRYDWKTNITPDYLLSLI